MCGIALSIGPEADPATFRRMLAALAPRGEVTETRSESGLLAGTRRLRVVDRDRAVQPWTSTDERWLLCFNGEIFNYRELRAQLTRLGQAFRTESDTEVLLAAFQQWGEAAVTRLRGEYAFAVVERATGRAYLARDPLGVKPLYWSRRPGCLQLASEVKALVGHGAPIAEVPPGHHGWAETGRARAPEPVRRPAHPRRRPAGHRRPGRGRAAGPRRAERRDPDAGGDRPDRRGGALRWPGQLADPAPGARHPPGLRRGDGRRGRTAPTWRTPGGSPPTSACRTRWSSCVRATSGSPTSARRSGSPS